jgi:2-polyprenyl-6-hydroxyphenyl methylase/3-demethylubiquinone-9 3-methyltransferase
MADKAAKTAASRKPGKARRSTAARDEIERFAAIAEGWWDPDGDFRPLHRLNPVRLEFIRDCVVGHFGRDPRGPAPLKGLSVLDIGCGGGLIAEPMRRLGARVTGIDADRTAIRVARLHAEEGGLDIDYRHRLPEDLAREKGRYDVVLNLEVVEHVADVGEFLAAASKLMKPKGAMVVSTINRTLKSLALAKIGAEYVLRWLPVGTHDWRKFVRPAELKAGLAKAGVEVRDMKGLVYNPIADDWRQGRDLGVNYLAYAAKTRR